MAGRNPIPPSYIVDLCKIVSDVYSQQDFHKSTYDIVIPVYQNNFKRDIAKKLVFLTESSIYQSIDSSFVEDIVMSLEDSTFYIVDKFETGNECGYKFSSIDVTHTDGSTITISYYWR